MGDRTLGKRARANGEGPDDEPEPHQPPQTGLIPALSPLPYPLCEVRSFGCLANTMFPSPYEMIEPAWIRLCWLLAAQNGLANPKPDEAVYYLPPSGWQVALRSEKGIVIAVRQGATSLAVKDFGSLLSLVARGFTLRVLVGTDRLYLPMYEAGNDVVVTQYNSYKLAPFVGKDLAFMMDVLAWLDVVLNGHVLCAIPAIARSLLPVILRGSPLSTDPVRPLLGLTDPAQIVTFINTKLESLGPAETVVAPFLMILRSPFCVGFSVTEKWNLIRDCRRRGMAVSILSAFVDALQVFGPITTSAMSGYLTSTGLPLPRKLARDVTAEDWVLLGTSKPAAGTNLVQQLDDETRTVVVVADPNMELYTRTGKSTALQKKGTLNALQLATLAGSAYRDAAYPLLEAPVEIVVNVDATAATGAAYSFSL